MAADSKRRQIRTNTPSERERTRFRSLVSIRLEDFRNGRIAPKLNNSCWNVVSSSQGGNSVNSNKGTKCDIEICDSRALFGKFKCAASESCTPPASLPREFLQAEKEDQEMEEACKRLIKTASSAGITSTCRRSWRRSKIPLNGRHSSMRWPTARRLPRGTSTCWASMIFRTKSYGTGWEFGSQN